MKTYRDIFEVYMSKSLGRDIDASRNKKPMKFAIVVDGATQEEVRTRQSANAKRRHWIKYIIQSVDYKATRAEAEALVVIKELK
jgi:hypothetical protein